MRVCVMTRTRLRPRAFRFRHPCALALAAMVVAGETDGPAAFTSADEATKPIDASDSVSPNSFFMFYPFQKELSRVQPWRVNGARWENSA
jgi:hypothetical protein